jgi:hypothetical protein
MKEKLKVIKEKLDKLCNNIYFFTLFIALTQVFCAHEGFRAGKVRRDVELLDAARKCSDHVLINVRKSSIHYYYGHKPGAGQLGNIFNHADAMVNSAWAKCFKKELYK